MSRIDKRADPAAETEPLFSTRLFLNAVMHRDYSGPAGHVALAIFGDRREIRSVGWLPSGITIDMLSGCLISPSRETHSSPTRSSGPGPWRSGVEVQTAKSKRADGTAWHRLLDLSVG